MDDASNRSKKCCELLIISLSVNHDIRVALVARDDNLEYRDDTVSMFIITRIAEYLSDGYCTDAFTEAVGAYRHGEIVITKGIKLEIYPSIGKIPKKERDNIYKI